MHEASGRLNAVTTVTTPPGSPVGLDHLVKLLLHGALPFAALSDPVSAPLNVIIADVS